MNNMTER